MKEYHATNSEAVKERNRRNWEELKADPLAYAAYNEKKAARRKTPEGRAKIRDYQREYQRKRRAAARDPDPSSPGVSSDR